MRLSRLCTGFVPGSPQVLTAPLQCDVLINIQKAFGLPTRDSGSDDSLEESRPALNPVVKVSFQVLLPPSWPRTALEPFARSLTPAVAFAPPGPAVGSTFVLLGHRGKGNVFSKRGTIVRTVACPSG